MKRTSFLALLAGLSLVFICGCGGNGGSDSETTASPEWEAEAPKSSANAGNKVNKYDLTDLPPVDEPLPRALDGGRLEICPPADWKPNSQANYLVVFAKKKVSELPRMTVAVVESPYGSEDTTEENGDALGKKILQKLQKDKKKIRENPKRVILGETTWVRHVRQVTMGGTPCAVQSLQVVRGGRLYSIEAFSAAKDDSQAAISSAVMAKVDGAALRDIAYAVAANARFKDAGSATPTKGEETKAPENPAETKPTETKPDEKPAETKPEEKKSE